MDQTNATLLLAGAILVGGFAVGRAAVDHVIDSRAGTFHMAAVPPATGRDHFVTAVAVVIAAATLYETVPNLIRAWQ